MRNQFLRNSSHSPVVVSQAFNPNTQDPEENGSLWACEQHDLQSWFQDSQGYTK